jgi:hypothetical protein
MIRFSYLLAVVPISVLLTASFFVLFTLRKVEEKGLRAFGYVVAGLLWLAALVIFSGAIYKMAQGSVMTGNMMRQKMKMGCMSQGMPKPDTMPMGMPEKEVMPKDQKGPQSSKCPMNKGIVVRAE